jgi:hypothetical protein
MRPGQQAAATASSTSRRRLCPTHAFSCARPAAQAAAIAAAAPAASVCKSSHATHCRDTHHLHLGRCGALFSLVFRQRLSPCLVSSGWGVFSGFAFMVGWPQGSSWHPSAASSGWLPAEVMRLPRWLPARGVMMGGGAFRNAVASCNTRAAAGVDTPADALELAHSGVWAGCVLAHVFGLATNSCCMRVLCQQCSCNVLPRVPACMCTGVEVCVRLCVVKLQLIVKGLASIRDEDDTLHCADTRCG